MYGDYECPHCKAAHPVVRLLQAEFDTNLRFAYRHFPLIEVHPFAEPAAEAAEAAGAQGEFGQMHDLLLQYSPRLEAANLLAIAAEIDLDVPRFAMIWRRTATWRASAAISRAAGRAA